MPLFALSCLKGTHPLLTEHQRCTAIGGHLLQCPLWPTQTMRSLGKKGEWPVKPLQYGLQSLLRFAWQWERASAVLSLRILSLHLQRSLPWSQKESKKIQSRQIKFMGGKGVGFSAVLYANNVVLLVAMKGLVTKLKIWTNILYTPPNSANKHRVFVCV